MGIGDQLLGTGMARGAVARGKRIAFGDGSRIIWDKNSVEIFRKNKNIAIPGSERDDDIEWIPFYRGHRLYNRQEAGRWVWNYEFRPIPGELFFSAVESNFANRISPDFVLIEPNVPWWKSVAVNKDWGVRKYQAVADELRAKGHRVAQFSYGKVRLQGVEVINAGDFRTAVAALAKARFAILPEGGLHHGAAAVGVRSVVIFGGFIPPAVTGYDFHINLTGGSEACGSIHECQHCRAALDAISVEDVLGACKKLIKGVA
jgi:hypothetical protein